MKINRKGAVATLVATALGLTITGAALAASGGGRATMPRNASDVAPPDRSVMSAFGAFRGPLTAPGDVAGQAQLGRGFASGPADLAETHADFDLARAAPVAGGSSNVWIAPSGGDVCTFIPDPVDGYGASCAPIAAIKAGKAVTVLGGTPDTPAESVIVAVLVPDGAAPPVVVVDGQTSTLKVTGNVAAARLPATAQVKTAAVSLDLSNLGRRDAAPRRVHG